MTSTATLITKLEKAVTNYRNARTPAQRDAAQRFMILRATELCDARDALYCRKDGIDSGKLVDGERWLDEHADDPRYEDRFTKWLEWEGTYRTICDALTAALDVWSPDGTVTA